MPVICPNLKVKDSAFILYHPLLSFTLIRQTVAAHGIGKDTNRESEAFTLFLISWSWANPLWVLDFLHLFSTHLQKEWKCGKPTSIIPSSANSLIPWPQYKETKYQGWGSLLDIVPYSKDLHICNLCWDYEAGKKKWG